MPNSAEIVVLEQTLLPIGSHQSIIVPWQDGYSAVAVQAVLSDDDLANPDVSLTMYVDTSNDVGQQTWSTASGGFSGGTTNPITGGLSVPLMEGGNANAKWVKMRVDLPQPLSIGFIMYFEP